MIFVKISSLIKAIPKIIVPKATNWSAFYLGFSFLIFCSCSTPKTVPVETLHHDTLYINKVSYDSIYIDNARYVDRSRDTIFIKETQLQYKYKLLRDTISIVQRDSIPYEVRITKVKEVEYIPPWCKWLSAIGGIAVLLLASHIFKIMK